MYIATPRYGVTNLYPRLNPEQGVQLNRFVEAFSHTISEASAAERRKYPEAYPRPEPDDVVLSDSAVRNMQPLMCYLLDANVNLVCSPDNPQTWESLYRVEGEDLWGTPLGPDREENEGVCAQSS
ncbi:hypothetical protein BX600DRAFT_157982 [Xylariales sp. PMI_506]|nr:hypothetical protein BX600DRAFT_157982 [Xylariales sp. PMI_506]